MRNALIAIIFVLSLSIAKCFSQNESPTAFHIDSLSAAGILLDKGWKFQAADNPDFAKPGYDDSGWQSINPALDIHDLPAISKTGICWLRLHLRIDSNLLDQQLALIINQATASEIYLNGRLIYNFGKISINARETEAYDPLAKPVSIQFDNNPEQVLAVRYSVQAGISYTNIWNRVNPILRIRINEINASFENYRYERGFATSIIFRMGLFLILAVLHFAYFYYYRPQKANLYLALFALFELSGLFQLNLPNEVKFIYYFSNLAVAFAALAQFFLLTAIYSLFGQTRG